MEQPIQSAPVERLYMRLVVGRQAKPDFPDAAAEQPPKKRGKTVKRPHPKAAGDFLLELTTFYVRPRRHAGA
jgi:hypothetical protein